MTARCRNAGDRKTEKQTREFIRHPRRRQRDACPRRFSLARRQTHRGVFSRVVRMVVRRQMAGHRADGQSAEGGRARSECRGLGRVRPPPRHPPHPRRAGAAGHQGHHQRQRHHGRALSGDRAQNFRCRPRNRRAFVHHGHDPVLPDRRGRARQHRSHYRTDRTRHRHPPQGLDQPAQHAGPALAAAAGRGGLRMARRHAERRSAVPG